MTRVFISHSTHDDPIVTAIREKLELRGIRVWTDSRELTPGDILEESITDAIDQSTHLIAVLSEAAIKSQWVKKEINYALNHNEPIKVIPLLVDPVDHQFLHIWFDQEPLAARVSVGPGGIEQALPDLFVALGLQLPNDKQAAQQKPEIPCADLILQLSDPAIVESEGKHRAQARAELIFKPADGSQEIRSKAYSFTAPLGAIEAEDLRWYLERWATWPSEHFKERADRIEKSLPEWGKQIYAGLHQEAARKALDAWESAAKTQKHPRRFTVMVDAELMDGSDDEAQVRANESATRLLALPWELLHDDRAYLFQGSHGVRVRRQLPNRDIKPPLITDPPIRILMVSPRPEDDHAAYIDHRVSVKPVVEALAPLGELVQLDILSPPTFEALVKKLEQAEQKGEPYHVVHFDGHGVYDRQHGLGALCFEHNSDCLKLENRRTHSVDAEKIAKALTDYRVPLFFLEACQSARAEQDPTASVASRLLQSGVASVVAMSHSILVETARRFTAAFYTALMLGETVGKAMLAGQRELHDDAFRFKGFSGDFCLQDWFVPVLFQENSDPQLITQVPATRVQDETTKQHQLSLGKLLGPPNHEFIGRSRELLMAERLLEQHAYVVLRGEGGEGKTTLAVELARWLVQSSRYKRVAFACLEEWDDAYKLLWTIGEQLVPEFPVEAGKDENLAMQFIQRQLNDQPTLIVLDNMETVLEPGRDSSDYALFEPEKLARIFEVCQQLITNSKTRIIFTSRESLPDPFSQHHVTIGRLERREAIELVGKVLGEGQLMPHVTGEKESEEEIEKLVEAVQCHARALVLLAGEIAKSGVRNATSQLHSLMANLQQRFPDDRERSLFASVELSLRRLPDSLRAKLGPLGFLHGGANLWIISEVLGLDTTQDEHIELVRQLVQVGLAEMLPNGYLRFDPALAPALRLQLAAQLDEEQQVKLEKHCCEVVNQFARFLGGQRFENTQLAASLTLLELPNLLAYLEWQNQHQDNAEFLVIDATRLEGMLQNLDRPRALARIVRIRSEASQHLDWSHARYLAESASVDRLLQASRLPEALAAAQTLLDKANAAGEAAYEEAAYDIAITYVTLGRILHLSSQPSHALNANETARQIFQRLADAGDEDAMSMVLTALTEKGDCLRDLGRLDEAAAIYQRRIELGSQGRENQRGIAVTKGQLGTVRLMQGKYTEALAAFEEARQIFGKLNEPKYVAVSLHQMGMVYEEMRQYDSAEAAYRQSLQFEVKTGDKRGEAETLLQLGNLYASMKRWEETVTLYRQAVEIFSTLQDLYSEGVARSNIANIFIKLKRFDEARVELNLALKRKASFGHAAEPWKTYSLLGDLETAEGNTQAALQARQQAINAFLNYRRDGGENLSGSPTIKLTEFIKQAVQLDEIEEVRQKLNEIEQDSELAGYLKVLVPVLQQILSGNRDPALADDPGLDYDDAAEVLLLLESLSVPEQA